MRQATFILSGAFALTATSLLWAQSNNPLSQAHAHNDYLHERPLLDALDHGFNSVEADIYLVDGQLLVAHTAKELQPDRTLEKLYLIPLKSRVAANAGSVYPLPASQNTNGTKQAAKPFGLLIDIKSDAEVTYRALHDVLEKYADMLIQVEADRVTPGAIQVVISGNRPQAYIATQTKRYCGIDGRAGDLDSTQAAHLMPMISENWGLQFFWRGIGPMPDGERMRLNDFVERAHSKGRTVRFWATPENETLWKTLLDAQVDLINTDQLSKLEKFLKKDH